MQRDLELVRILLGAIEANPDPQEWIDPEPAGYTPDQVSYHIMLMEQAGLIEAWNRSAIGVFRWSAGNLTWHGHEIYAASTNQVAWDRTLKKLTDVAPGLVFELFAESLMSEIRSNLNKGL